MRLLLSNDDGVDAEGLRALAEALLPLGEVTVCAPDREQSATSHSISLHRPLRIEAMPPWGPKGEIQRFSVDGTPTDSVYVGVNHILKDARPDLVVSGINKGANLANDVLYSGTVAAAMEGVALGLPAFAVSLVGRSPQRDYTYAAAFALALAPLVLQRGLPKGALLNVNVPQGEPQGVRITKLGTRSYATNVVQKVDPRGRAYYWIGGDERAHEDIAGSDCNAVFDDRCISVTPLRLDLTQVPLVEELAGWPIPGVEKRR